MFIDSHTHKILTGANLSIVNCYPVDLNLSHPQKYSCGIHPWYIKINKIEEWFTNIELLCRQNKIAAIGECGLDKNVKNMEIQKNVFKEHIRLSEKYDLPMIVHSVKTHHSILQIRKNTQSIQPWLVHGYSGSVETAKQFATQNIFISLGENLIKHPDKFQKLLNQINMDFVLFETDDSEASIVEIYHQAAKLLNLELGKLQQKIEINFKKVFG